MADTNDSWEDSVGDQVASVALNAGATEWKPSVDAPAFIPSFAMTPAPVEPEAAPAPVEPEAPAPKQVEEAKPKAKVAAEPKAKASPKASPKPADSNGPSPSTSKKKKEIKEIAPDLREHVSVVFIGHVDAGKSTLGGQIMYMTGQVDDRTMDKYKREAKEKGRGSWALSWALDSETEERDKGKTVETARAHFDTTEKRFTILDAPGHKLYVPEMISGASQADIAVLVVSARIREFEAGFKRGGQTSEHAMLVKTAGVKKIVVVVNKMDDPSVMWKKERYDEIVGEIKPFLTKKVGFQKGDITFMPLSGFSGANVKDKMEGEAKVAWYNGPSLLGFLNDLPSFERGDPKAPLRIPVMDGFKDMGSFAMGKIEQGSVHVGDALVVMPHKVPTEVLQIFCDEVESTWAGPGENVRLKLRSVEEDQLQNGMVICRPDNPVRAVRVFDVKLQFSNYPTIIMKGFKSVIHVHGVRKEVQIKELIATLNKKTGKIEKKLPKFVKEKEMVICRLELDEDVCLEAFNDCPQLGRFTLREKSETIAMGRIMKLR